MVAKKISLFSLILLIVAAIDSIRNLPSSAIFGSSLIFFFLLAAVVFLIPVSLISAYFSSSFPSEGGIYYWIKTAFGEKWGVVAIWLQWINTMVWYPTVLSFIAATSSYLVDPSLASNSHYLVVVIISVLWILTLVNLKGIHFSLKINNICAILGTVLPLFLLIILGLSFLFTNEVIYVSFTPKDLIPDLRRLDEWTSLVAIMASFLGMELAGVHVNDIANPQKNFPKAILIASFFILITMLGGSLSIAFILPSEEIHLVAGVMQAFDKTPLKFLTPLMTLFIVLGTMGGMTNWLISPAKGLMQAAEYGFLPQIMKKKNKNGVASYLLITQAVLISIFTFCFLFHPSVNQFYWFLTALSTQLYMCMYILMFLGALYLHKKNQTKNTFQLPGKTPGFFSICGLGILGCLITIVVSFIPPSHLRVESYGTYLSVIGLGNLLSLSPLVFLFWYKKKYSRS
ncbi:MAG: APC family permease [Rhabdochlamydiaceae bacterium]